MDYILFHSQYSASSRKLLEEFPTITEKGVLVDSAVMRTYAKKLHIVCVPTLVIILDNKIVERIVGYEHIQNWLLVTLYRVNKLQPFEPDYNEQETSWPSESPPSSENNNPQFTQEFTREVSSNNQVEEGTTNLDNLILEDIVENPPLKPVVNEPTTPHVQMGLGANTMQLAEAMKKERDNIDPGNKKKFNV
jgi:hypothetical protein